MGTLVNQAKIISVGAMGFDMPELRLINNVLRITSCRPQIVYKACEKDETSNCDVLIVNADDASALACLVPKSDKQGGSLKLLVFSADPDSTLSTGDPYCLRPLSPVKLLALLDKLVFEKQLQEPANQIFSGKNKTETVRAHHADESIDASKIFGFPKYRRFLIVDDSPTVRKQLELELKDSHVNVDSAETGEAALELIETNSYDIIFLDVVLPGADGYQVCKNIKKNPAFKRTPVVMLTSKSSPFDRVRGSLAGCDTYLTKPVDYEKFRQVLEEYEMK